MPDKKLTDKEIIKALESRMYKENKYMFSLLQSTLDLINHLQAEIERLKNAYKQVAWERNAYIEIENTAIAEAKAEAYKEFAYKLKEKPTKYFYESNRDMTIPLVSFDRIDNLLKELVGDAECS